MGPRIGRLLLAAFVLVGLAAAQPSSAAVTIGSNLAEAPTLGLLCGTPTCTTASPTLAGGSQAAGGTASPIDGVVVRWRVRAGAAGPTKLRVLRPGGGDVRTGVGTGPVENPTPDAVSTFNVQLPIKAGDNIGIDIDNSGPNYYNDDPVAGNVRLSWQPALADGATAAAHFNQNQREVLINADVEADCDGDGKGDETQDADTVSCTAPTVPMPSASPSPDPACKGLIATIVVPAGSGPVTGTAGRDVIFGSAGPDRIDGGGGNDVICPNAGNDRVSGGGGNDRVSAFDGNDRISGGAGNDRLSGSDGNDRVSGGPGRDRIWGRDGNDRLWGNAGRDRIGGGSGSDRLWGSGGGDRLSGGLGNDRLSGGSGKDRLTGDSGRDRFRAGSGADVVHSRDRRRERVRCGSGDRVRADRYDRLLRCAQVSRR